MSGRTATAPQLGQDRPPPIGWHGRVLAALGGAAPVLGLSRLHTVPASGPVNFDTLNFRRGAAVSDPGPKSPGNRWMAFFPRGQFTEQKVMAWRRCDATTP